MTTGTIVAEIKSRIREFRGRRVMLDRDVAALFGMTTKRVNGHIRRNPGKFSEDFVFQLTDAEIVELKDEYCGPGRPFKPLCYTENGVILIAFDIRTPLAAQISVGIIRAFISVREAEDENLARSFGSRIESLETRQENLEMEILLRQKLHSGTTAQRAAEGAEVKVKQNDQHMLAKIETHNHEIEKIKKVVADYFDLPLKSLTSTRRHKKIAKARQIAMYLARKLTGSSFKDLGSEFGGKDHTTIIYACDKIEEALKNDVKIQEYISDIQARLTH